MSKVLTMWQGMTGTVLPYALATAPDGWLLCDGSALEAGTADILRAKLLADGSPYGDDGNGNPLLPDLRGEFIRGLDGGRGVDSGRVLGSTQDHAMERVQGTFYSYGSEDADPFGVFDLGNEVTGRRYDGTGTAWQVNFDNANVVNTADENRPRNVAMNHIIKT